jgi:hypothetical protein
MSAATQAAAEAALAGIAGAEAVATSALANKTRRTKVGQTINFAIEHDPDKKISGYIWIEGKAGQNIAQIAAAYGHPELAATIASDNHIRSVHFKLKNRIRLRVPDSFTPGESFTVVAGDQPPTVTDGYALLTVVARDNRVGLAQFGGYNPIAMDVPVQFIAWPRFKDGADIENDCALLERMAGRGDYSGAAKGPPAILRLSTTQGGKIVPLIPSNYQWSPANVDAPLWRIEAISWDTAPVRDRTGQRTRQLATVTVWQYTPLSIVSRSATERAKSRNG